MFSRIVIAIAFIAVPAVWSYSAGAPPEVCGDLLPKHHVAPQSSRSPYAVTISSEQVRSGDTITIKIAGKSPKDTIKGFFVEVLDGNNKPIGSFDIDPQHPLIQTRNCFGGLNVSIFFLLLLLYNFSVFLWLILCLQYNNISFNRMNWFWMKNYKIPYYWRNVCVTPSV